MRASCNRIGESRQGSVLHGTRSARAAPTTVLATIIAFAAASGSAFAAEPGYFSLLRGRDLTPFGLLRLDMRPTHAITAEPGTWALSPQVEKYLTDLPFRRNLGDTELANIRALPGDNYLVDLELAEVDVTYHYKFTRHWGTFLTLSAVSYDGGFIDSAIEAFHGGGRSEDPAAGAARSPVHGRHRLRDSGDPAAFLQ
jgi:hypothetical protein